LSANVRRKGVALQTLLVLENYSDCPFMRYHNIRSALFGFVIKHACDGQTERQTELRQLIPR